MAVDANVLIYERIREEARQGRSAIASIDLGFKRALGTIVDANITTLIAALALFCLGSGPVRGFAVTYAIGIVTTMFTAFTFTRLHRRDVGRRRRPAEDRSRSEARSQGSNSDAPLRLIPDDTKHPLHVAAAVSISPYRSLLSVSRSSCSSPIGPQYGIDFRGGTLIEMQADTDTDDARRRSARRSKASASATSRCRKSATSTSGTNVLVRIQQQAGGETAQQDAIDQGPARRLGDTVDFRRIEVVGPRVSSELAYNGTIAHARSRCSAS